MKTKLLLLLAGAVCVSANAAIVLRDDFNYPNGTLTNVSAGKWRHTSGGADQYPGTQ